RGGSTNRRPERARGPVRSPPMRTPRLLLALLAALLGLPAGSAAAAVTVGISENNPQMFDDPLFQALDVEHTRVVVSYDVMRSGDDELARVTHYLNSARAAG